MVKSKSVPKILLADDSTHAQRMGTKILAAEGIEVVTASNGEAALKKMGEVEVDLVLADVYMPGLDGYEVCQWVKKSPEYSFVPVVLVVGALELYEPDKIAQVQADGLLKKPFEATAMIDTLRPLLEVAAKAREKKKPKKAPVEDAEEERTVRLSASPVAVEETIPAPAPVEAMEVPPEVADIPFGMDMGQESAAGTYGSAASAPEIDLASVEFAMPGVEPTESAEVTIPTEFQETAPAPAPAAAIPEVAAEPAPEPAPVESVYGVEAPAEEPVEVKAETPAEVVVEEVAPPPAPEPEPAPAPPPPELEPRWVAEPAEVTKQDQALFEPAVAAAPPKPEAPPDWNELLKSVEEPAAVPAAAAAATAAVVATKEEPASPSPAPPPAKVDEDAVRTAVQLCLENALPTLVEDITASVIRRLNK